MRLENKRRLEIRVSWNEIHRHMRELAGWIHELRKEGRQIDIIIGVTRGGLTFEAVLARELNIRENIETIGISSYSSYSGPAGHTEARIMKPIGAEVMAKVKDGGANVLVVDDLVDSGSSFRKVREILPNALYATIYSKPAGEEATDIRLLQAPANSWVIFPWDTTDGVPQAVEPISGPESD